ncbi:MAG: hypothetical protein UX75_C0029G0017 [Candidatus Moranbacteria bacterium GW2011_GWE2_47_10]|nr:MAG: hypothetical protein UX75_C0029G0017 [Candidatus Moranbacteria bacterium GW2011_GWE2_47_10]
MKKRVFIIHGWGGSPEGGCLPWLKSKLEKNNFEVIAPQMPNTEEPKIREWVPHLSKLVGSVDENTFFVGHSIGCQAIMRYLEKTGGKTGGALYLAGWFVLENLPEEEIEIAREWTETPIDLEKVKDATKNHVLIISDNDPFGGFEKNKEMFSRLGAKIIILPGAEHIENLELPVALEEIIDLTK